MPVNTLNDDYSEWKPIWEKVRDVVCGQDKIKSKTVRYLPKLPGQPADLQDDGSGYKGYLDRAQFNGFTSRTLAVSLGQIFRKAPAISGIDDQYLQNITLSGQSFTYFSHHVIAEVMQTNRCGILVEYSDDERRPYLIAYKAENIINWQEDVYAGGERVVRIVLEGERYVSDPDDPFEQKEEKVWRELYLEDGIYKARSWEKIELNGKDVFSVVDGSEEIPTMGMKGEPFKYIPFFFVTATGMNHELSNPMLLDLANINLGHYKNSADYENMLHITGAKTVLAMGWSDEIFPIGGLAKLSTDGDAKYLEASSDSGLKDEMKHKEELMAALGSQILSGRGRYVSSAQTAQITSEGEYATLADLANSLSYCMTWIMKLFIEWANGNPGDVSIEFNTDYQVQEIQQGKLTELMAAVQSGMMSFETYYYLLSKYEAYPQDWTMEKEIEGISVAMNKQVAARESQASKEAKAVYDNQGAGA